MKRARKILMPPSEACVRIIIHVPYDTLHPRTPLPSPSLFPLSAIRPNDGKCRQNDGVLRARGHRNLQACGQTLPRLLWVVTGRSRGARRLQHVLYSPLPVGAPFQPPAEDARPRAAPDSVALVHWRSAPSSAKACATAPRDGASAISTVCWCC